MCFAKYILDPKQIGPAGHEAQAHLAFLFFLFLYIFFLAGSSTPVWYKSQYSGTFFYSRKVYKNLQKTPVKIQIICTNENEDWSRNDPDLTKSMMTVRWFTCEKLDSNFPISHPGDGLIISSINFFFIVNETIIY